MFGKYLHVLFVCRQLMSDKPMFDLYIAEVIACTVGIVVYSGSTLNCLYITGSLPTSLWQLLLMLYGSCFICAYM